MEALVDCKPAVGRPGVGHWRNKWFTFGPGLDLNSGEVTPGGTVIGTARFASAEDARAAAEWLLAQGVVGSTYLGPVFFQNGETRDG